MRLGMGYDVHQLTEGRKLIIGGVEIPYEKGLLGHSDADVLLHAIMDALGRSPQKVEQILRAENCCAQEVLLLFCNAAGEYKLIKRQKANQ